MALDVLLRCSPIDAETSLGTDYRSSGTLAEAMGAVSPTFVFSIILCYGGYSRGDQLS